VAVGSGGSIVGHPGKSFGVVRGFRTG